MSVLNGLYWNKKRLHIVQSICSVSIVLESITNKKGDLTKVKSPFCDPVGILVIRIELAKIAVFGMAKYLIDNDFSVPSIFYEYSLQVVCRLKV